MGLKSPYLKIFKMILSRFQKIIKYQIKIILGWHNRAANIWGPNSPSPDHSSHHFFFNEGSGTTDVNKDLLHCESDPYSGFYSSKCPNDFEWLQKFHKKILLIGNSTYRILAIMMPLYRKSAASKPFYVILRTEYNNIIT